MGEGKEGQVRLDLDQGQTSTNRQCQNLSYFFHDYIYIERQGFVRSGEGYGKGKTE